MTVINQKITAIAYMIPKKAHSLDSLDQGSISHITGRETARATEGIAMTQPTLTRPCPKSSERGMSSREEFVTASLSRRSIALAWGPDYHPTSPRSLFESYMNILAIAMHYFGIKIITLSPL